MRSTVAHGVRRAQHVPSDLGGCATPLTRAYAVRMTSTAQLILVGNGRGSRVAHYAPGAYSNSICGRHASSGYNNTDEWFWHGDVNFERELLEDRAVCKQCTAIRARMLADESAQVEEPAAPVEAGTAVTADRDRILVQPDGTTDPSERVWVPKGDVQPSIPVGPYGVETGTPVVVWPQVEESRHVHAPETNGAYSAYSRHGYGVCTCGWSIYREPFGGWLTLGDILDAYREHFERGHGNLMVGNGVAVHARIGSFTHCGAGQHRCNTFTASHAFTVAPVTCRSCLKHAR